MAEDLRPDICVIGAGSGGLTVAAAAAAFGVAVVLVERGRMGGDCLNYGCVPSKALIAAARQAAAIREAAAFGITATGPEVDFGRVMAGVREAIAAIAPNDSVERFEGLGVRVIRAEGRFLDPRTLAAGGLHIRARRFVIATGSSPRLPPVEGLADVPFLTNETLFDLRELPAHLLVLGGGPIGTEMAQAFRRLGSAVTLVQSGRLLPADDPELTRVVAESLAADGVAIREHAKALEVRRDADGGIALLVESGGRRETLSGSHLLVAAGRTPSTAGLDLDAAGVRHGPKGVAVTAGLRTANRRIYAVGDASGAPFYTHAAGYEAGLAVRALLFRLPVRRDPGAVPHATFCDPPLAAVGLGEDEAKARFGAKAITVLRFPYAEIDRAITERRRDGLVKLVVGRRGRLLGAGIVGRDADEIMNLLSLAIAKRMGVADLAGFISPYPTLGEIAKRAAAGYFRPYAGRPLVRRLVQLLARFG